MKAHINKSAAGNPATAVGLDMRLVQGIVNFLIGWHHNQRCHPFLLVVGKKITTKF
jgi:hypothetical protein